MNIFQIRTAPSFRTEDKTTLQDAVEAIEAAGGGSVVKFIREPNLPNLCPPFVDRSCAMWTYEHGQWREVWIFSSGGSAKCDRPTEGRKS